jgi:hypothetical protein
MRARRTVRALVILAFALAMGPAALAVSDEEIFRDFPFYQVSPGARALGLGGAFISLADDATAAQANPAGLVNLRRPELFAELRSQRYETSSTQVGGSLDTLFFRGTLSAAAASEPEDTLSPTFISYVLPLKRVALGFSRLESLNARTSTLNSFEIEGVEAIIEQDPDTGDWVITGFNPVDYALTAEANLDARIVQWNVAVSIEAHRRFLIGVTGVIGTAEVTGRVDNLFWDRAAGPLDPFGFPTLDYATRIDDSDIDYTFNAGLLWKPADWVSIGAVYRGALEFVLTQRVLDVGVRAPQAQQLHGAQFENVLNTPDSYGGGISFRPSDPWTILLDVVQVNYSNLLEGYRSGLNRITFPQDDIEFTVDDGTEYHFGLERIFLSGTTPIAARIGAWSDPDHRIRYAGDDPGLQAIFPGGEAVTHVTAGFGLTLKQSIQLDFAFDYSDVNTNAVFSFIYRF